MFISKSMKRIGIVLVCFSVLFFSVITASFYFLKQQENDAILINIAGRQRMLSQKITKELFLYILTGDKELPTEIVRSKNLFAESLDVLINGGTVQQDLKGRKYDTTSPSKGMALEQLKRINQIWIDFDKNVGLLLNNPADEEVLEDIKSKNTILLEELDQVVYLLQKNSESNVKLMFKIEIATFLLGIIIAIIFSLYFYNKKVEEKRRYLSIHDQLTGLYNRAFFEEALKRIDSESFLPLTVVMGDANGLKIVNDAFGHQVGDKFLQTIANTIKDICRKDDIITRWGGDEFVILLPQTTIEDGQKIIKWIKEKFANMEPDPIRPSIAFGCATKVDKNTDDESISKR